MSATIALAQADQTVTRPETEGATTADLKITVHDPSGAMVPNSAVTVKATSGDGLYEGKTDASGVWTANGIAIGTYKLHIMASGFKTKDEDVRVVAPETSVVRTLMIGDFGSPIISDLGFQPPLQLYPSLVQIDLLPLIPQPIFRKR